jgi:hypothetical protein
MAMPGKINVKPARLAPSSDGGRTINKYRVQRATSADPQTVPTAPRSPTAIPSNTTVKAAWLASFADRDLSASSAVRSEGGELTTTGASTWWLLITGGLLVSVAIGLRLVEAWRRKR